MSNLSIGVNSFDDLNIASLAVEASKLRLEGTKMVVGAAATSLLPPGSEMASFKALAQQQTSIMDYFAKLSSGTSNLSTLASAAATQSRNFSNLDETASASINTID